jgi:hypothetical protein
MAQTNQKVKTVLNSPKLRLVAPCPTAKGKWSHLSFDIYMNNPRIVVATNDPSMMSPEKGFGRIQAALDMPTFYAFIELLTMAINSKEATKSKIENFGHQKGGDPKVPTLLTDLWVGRDDAGLIFISAISKQDGWPVIKFTFGPADERYHKFYHGDGSEFSKAERSNVYARAYAKMLSEAMGNLMVSHYVEPPPYVPNKGGGNWNKGNSSGGYQKPSTYVDNSSDDSSGDDGIPF